MPSACSEGNGCSITISAYVTFYMNGQSILKPLPLRDGNSLRPFEFVINNWYSRSFEADVEIEVVTDGQNRFEARFPRKRFIDQDEERTRLKQDHGVHPDIEAYAQIGAPHPSSVPWHLVSTVTGEDRAKQRVHRNIFDLVDPNH